MFKPRKTAAPGPSQAIHVAPDGRRSLCNQSMAGEPELPAGTPATCPVCVRIAEKADSPRSAAGRRNHHENEDTP